MDWAPPGCSGRWDSFGDSPTPGARSSHRNVFAAVPCACSAYIRCRAADALQLAAALMVAEEDPGLVDFVSGDARLAEAARREGFTVL